MKKTTALYLLMASIAALPLQGFSAKRSTKITRFDFMIAIEEGNVIEVGNCLDKGFDINDQWGEAKKTPLMYAIEKLASEKENQENINWNALYATTNVIGVSGLGYGAWAASGNVLNFVEAFKTNYLDTFRKRYPEALGYSLGGLAALCAVIFMISSFGSNTKKIAEYLYYRWRISTSRLIIIENLLKCPTLDLSIRNAVKGRDSEGQTALELVQELQKKGLHSGYINDLLYRAEQLILQRMKQDAAALEAAHLEVAHAEVATVEAVTPEQDAATPEVATSEAVTQEVVSLEAAII